MKVHIIPILRDNYAYLIESGGKTAVIDPGEARPVIYELETRKLDLDYIINTHHHGDHIAGNEELREEYNAPIVAPNDPRIPNIDMILKEGERFNFGDTYAEILHTPGHTTTHICLHFPQSHDLFTGDVIFSMGCGGLFEGTAHEMWGSFEKILRLPDQTKIYCGHEYTIACGRFCRAVEPDNKDIESRLAEAEELRAEGKPTLPVTLGTEKKTNVFLRAGSGDALANIREKKRAS